MRARSIILASATAAAILAVGGEVGIHAATVAAAGSAATLTMPPSTSTDAPPAGAPSAGTPAPETSASSGSPAAGQAVADGSYTGTLVRTPFGDVQVQVLIVGGAITDVKAIRLSSDGGRSAQINNEAAPILRSEVLKAQSARVDAVSGATYTSDGYLSSLQAALDGAHRG